MKRRGQAALEYLMNYWWALLIIIIIGVLVWRFLIGGVTTTPTWLPFRMSKVPVTALSVFDNGTAFVTIENREQDTINLTYFEISAPNPTGGNCVINSSTTLPATVAMGGSLTFTLTNSTPCNIPDGTSVTANFTMKYIIKGVPQVPTDQQTVQIQRSGV